MRATTANIPYVLLVLLQICCISLSLVSAVPVSSRPRAPPKPGYRQNTPPPAAGPSAPRPPSPPVPVWPHGAVVGARAKFYEPNSKVTTMHPGIVVAGPDQLGMYRVAMISNKLPGNGPRAQTSRYMAGTGIGGEISTGYPKIINGKHLRSWKRKDLGEAPPLAADKLALLKADINKGCQGTGFVLSRRDLAARGRSHH